MYIQAVPDFHIFSFWTANTFMHYTSTLPSAFCMPNPDFRTSADQRTFCADVWWHCLTAKSSVWAAMPSLSVKSRLYVIIWIFFALCPDYFARMSGKWTLKMLIMMIKNHRSHELNTVETKMKSLGFPSWHTFSPNQPLIRFKPSPLYSN